MGARGETEGEWRDDLHKPAIVIGHRRRPRLRRRWKGRSGCEPGDRPDRLRPGHQRRALDHRPARLCPQAATTLRQVAGFAANIGTAEPFGLTCRSPTTPGELLGTPDNPATEKRIQIRDLERSEALAIRLAALRAVRRLPAGWGDYRAIATAVLERRRPGASPSSDEHRRRRPAPLSTSPGRAEENCSLLHPRFRGLERVDRLAAVLGGPNGPIVVTTQVVEAGLTWTPRCWSPRQHRGRR